VENTRKHLRTTAHVATVVATTMASLRKKPRSPFFFARFMLPDGTRTDRSTKLTDRRAAMKMAVQWEEAAAKRITESQARKVLSDIHEQLHGSPLKTKTVVEFKNDWLKDKEGVTEAITLKTYKQAVDEFIAALGEKASQPIQYVTKAHVMTWRNVAAVKASRRTSNNKLKVVRIMFQSAVRDGLLTENPAALVPILKSADSTRRAFTMPELKTVIGVASVEWRGLILAGLYLGQRLKDLASLTWANVDLEKNEIRLTTSKTARFQQLPLAKPLRKYLDELDAGDDPNAPIFPKAYPFGIKSGGTATLSQQFHGLLVSAGLAKPRPPKHVAQGVGRGGARTRSEITFHSLRHTATSLLKAAGVSESVTRDIIGHESAEISRHYTHVEGAAKRAAIAKLPDITK
jgi:integrase